MKFLKALFISFALFVSTICNAERLTCIGNSMTIHLPKADIGWDGKWGMAASSQATDYCHVLAKKIAERRNIQITAEPVNISQLENLSISLDQIKNLNIIDYSSEYIVIYLGDNFKGISPNEMKAFSERINYLLQKIDLKKSRVFILGTWWTRTDIDNLLMDVSLKNQITFVSLKGLSTMDINLGKYKKPMINAGVGAHPNDIGMEKISEAIMQRF
ncbi:hypothetical protein [Methylophilus sp. TWE2]|uniref:hypothetical protein n=1 Tax=Methylophilus sp. TWE2 TaxID=1662285 RepID=UPI000670F79D|nr:hypothetical protein [Methylophilus sp. TWE2]AKR43387.1 hypothetical protein ACJ67_08070 [Methylophilus sp. TWE2]